MSDMVKRPKHYASILGEKLGIEVIDVANALELNGNRFSMLKYLCRAGLKDPAKEVEDLEKIIQYATFEIRRLKGEPISDTRREKDNGLFELKTYAGAPAPEGLKEALAAAAASRTHTMKVKVQQNWSFVHKKTGLVYGAFKDQAEALDYISLRGYKVEDCDLQPNCVMSSVGHSEPDE